MALSWQIPTVTAESDQFTFSQLSAHFKFVVMRAQTAAAGGARNSRDIKVEVLSGLSQDGAR
ncbi:hypothetical protein CAL20_17285 [Bordetella genomosp. 4]|uniref:Uncharacterized protein n=1 Tax=Bordetella genomosp. 4 TaxID=463044 RepID=A0A261TYA9_9BORD|nr:hypothetical protein CAL20_17285 [Bordetella genomosp. 4]